MAGTPNLEFELENEFESEYESEYEYEGEFEGEEEFGSILGGISSLLGESEYEDEFESEEEYEDEFEGEYEGEQFFGKIGRFFKKAAPMLGRIAKVAAPLVGTAVGGPLGGMLGKAVGGMLPESEFEYEDEFESEYEDEYEGEYEDEDEFGHPMTQHEAMAEMMAAAASQSLTETEAEAMVGASTATIISASDRRALRQILPHLVRGTAILTRILRRRRSSRPAVRAVPHIIKSTVKKLASRAAAGKPITRAIAAKTMAKETRRILSNPRTCAHAVARNIKATRMAKRQTLTPRARRSPRRYAGIRG